MTFVDQANLFGVDPKDPNGKDDVTTVSELHAVVNKPVIAYISSKDVIHSFQGHRHACHAGRDTWNAHPDLVRAHRRRQVPDQLRATLRQRPFRHVRRGAGSRKPG